MNIQGEEGEDLEGWKKYCRSTYHKEHAVSMYKPKTFSVNTIRQDNRYPVSSHLEDEILYRRVSALKEAGKRQNIRRNRYP